MAGYPDRRDFLSLSAVLGATYLSSNGFSATYFSDNKVMAYQHEIPVGRDYDVVVCGGGPSGIASSLAASRAGLKVLLVEGQGQLGGMSTSGHVSHCLGGRSLDCKQWIVGGIFREIAQEAAERGAASDTKGC